MGPWGRNFPRGTPGRPIRAPGSPILGFGAGSFRTCRDPRQGTPRSPSGKNIAPRTQGGSGPPLRAPGGRIRPESTCFPVAPARLRGPESPHPGPAPGAPEAAGPERAPRVAPQEARSPASPRGSIASVRWPAGQLRFCRGGCPSRAHTRRGLRNGCPQERAPRVLAIIPTDGPTRLEYNKCREPRPKRPGEPSGVAGTKACSANASAQRSARAT